MTKQKARDRLLLAMAAYLERINPGGNAGNEHRALLFAMSDFRTALAKRRAAKGRGKT